MNPLDLSRVYRFAPYKVWTHNGHDYNIETTRGHIFMIGFMDDYSEGKTRSFAALIVQKSNPRLNEILAEFDETISILSNKPE